MKNKPVLDGKITDDKVFLKIFWKIGKTQKFYMRTGTKFQRNSEKTKKTFPMLIYQRILLTL